MKQSRDSIKNIWREQTPPLRSVAFTSQRNKIGSVILHQASEGFRDKELTALCAQIEAQRNGSLAGC